MNSWLRYILFILALAFPAALTAQEAKLEPCYVYEIAQTITIKGQTKTGRESCFTDAELPWANLGFEPPHYLLETGSKRTEEPAMIDFGGKKKAGTKVTWKCGQAVNVHADAVHFWVLKELDTPTFTVRLSQGYHRFVVPSGCVKMEVVPLKKNAENAGEFAINNSLAATGECSKEVKYKLGETELKAHEFVCKIANGKFKGTMTYTLSKEIAEGICSITIDGDVKLSMRVAAKTPAPAPKGLDFFAREGFAYAPPSGYMKAPTPGPGEVVRYLNGDGNFISVAIVPLGKGGLKALRDKMSDENAKDGLRYTGDSRDRHLAGHRGFIANDRKTKVPYVVTQHGGRGYIFGASALDKLQPDDVREFIRGWRWLVPDKK